MDPFQTPRPSLPNANSSTTALRRPVQRMKAHLLPETLLDGTTNPPAPEKSPIPKPWLDKPQARTKISYWMVYALAFVGIAAGAVQCYFTYVNTRTRMVIAPGPGMCLAFEDDFTGTDEETFGVQQPDGTFRGGRWMREVDMSGFGNGEFEMTTASSNNSFIKDGYLWIVPTLTSDSIGIAAVEDGAVYNITGCTYNQTHMQQIQQLGFDEADYLNSCSKISNRTAGALIPPVQSARLTTANTASLRYGMLQIRAKMPRGDWLWPAIWMLPLNNSYGPWPLSGEIDIAESRGNGLQYTNRGRNYVQGTLNWGLDPQHNENGKSYSWWSDKRHGFDEEFHTYTLEWTEKFLRISVDTRLHTLLDISFDKTFFKRGDFPNVITNATTGALQAVRNPWEFPSDEASTNSAPFDREFYLVLNVAVGGRNGWFPDGQGNKPWLNPSERAMSDFWNAKGSWYETWVGKQQLEGAAPPTNALVVDWVKMWKRC